MTNNSIVQKNPNETFFTTPKMIKSSIAGDVIWQFLSQTVDPLIKSDNTLYALSFIYPLFITTIIGAAAFADSLRKKEEEYEKDSQENKDIAWAVLLGMYGWMSGYYLASYGFGADRWGCASMAGIVSAIPLLIYSVLNDKAQDKKVSTATYAVAGTSFFFTAFGWYLAYILPKEIPSNVMPEWVSEAFISPAVTFAITGVGLGMLKLWEAKISSKKPQGENVSATGASISRSPLFSASA